MGLTFQVLLCSEAGFYQDEWWAYNFNLDEWAANRFWLMPATRWLLCDGVARGICGPLLGGRGPVHGFDRERLTSDPWCPSRQRMLGWTELLFSQHGRATFCASSPGSCGHRFPMLLDPVLLLIWVLAALWESRTGSVASEWRAEMFYFQVSCWLPLGSNFFSLMAMCHYPLHGEKQWTEL